LAWIFLKEKIGRGTLVAITATIAGIGLMTADGLGTGLVLGNFAALGNALTFAVFILLLRRWREIDMLPAVGIGAFLALVVASIMAPLGAVPVRDAVICLAWGAIIQCAGLSLVTSAARTLQVAETSLIGLIEFVLAPIWTWLAIGEVPSTLAMLGGGMVLTSVSIWSVASAMPRRIRVDRSQPS
jgi:drug/metabolite transporter, DME family